MARISEGKREDAYRRSGNRCWFCGLEPPEHIEHLTPRARGGTDDLSNLVGACAKCNRAKEGQRVSGQPNWDLEEFRAEVARRLKVPVEEVQFFGERLRIARRAAMDSHPNVSTFIRLGSRDDLVVMPKSFVIPEYEDGWQEWDDEEQ